MQRVGSEAVGLTLLCIFLCRESEARGVGRRRFPPEHFPTGGDTFTAAAAEGIWKKLLLAHWWIRFSRWWIRFSFSKKKQKSLLRTRARRGQEQEPSGPRFPVPAEPSLLLSLPFFNTSEFILSTGSNVF